MKTGTAGLVDTYTITYDSGSPDTFTVTNGKNGTTVWKATGSPSSIRWDESHYYMGWTAGQLSGRSGLSPATGDLVFYGTYYYVIAGYKSGYWCCDSSAGVSIKGSPGTNGTNGQDGAPGAGVASGGTTGQYLKKKSGTDYDTEWGTFPSIPSSASDVGAVASNQGSGNAGKFLVVGNDGVVTPVTMTAWSGGNY